MKIILTLALPLTTFLTTTAYGADVTTYSSRATFLGGLAGADTWDFNGPDGNPVVILNSAGANIVGVSTQGGRRSRHDLRQWSLRQREWSNRMFPACRLYAAGAQERLWIRQP